VKEDLQDHVLEGVEIHYARTVEQALDWALSKTPTSTLAVQPGQVPPAATPPAVH
jgi:hypothetical protein